MADQIVLSWVVDVAGAPISAADLATRLGAVELYDNPITDPTLGQFFGLTVASDVSAASGPTEATRTLTLNMDADNSPTAPPPFPCQPVTSDPPTLPYPLTRAQTLGGEFFATNGSAVVPTSQSQRQTLSAGDVIQFVSQEGVQYTVLSLTEAAVTLTAPFTGTSGNTEAFERVQAPATRPAVYSTSDLDRNEITATGPTIPAGPGAHDVEIEYFDSTGAGPFTAEVELTGRRPAEVPLDPGSIDIAIVTAMVAEDPGAFENSVGQITLVDLAEPLPELPFEPTPDEFRGRLTDEAQLLIDRPLVYLPPSYFAMSQQQASAPQLEGDFLVTTGSRRVVTEVDQTGVLATGHIIQFASQLTAPLPTGTRQVFYVVEDVAERSITLTEPYTGVDATFTGENNLGTLSNIETKGTVGKEVLEKATGAYLIEPTNAASPSDDQLAVHLAEHVEEQTAGPPPNAPLPPATVPAPTFLSDIFTRTLQGALAGIPIAPQEITFLP